MNNCIYRWVVRHWEIPVCGVLPSLLLLLHITSLRHKGLTTDELLHYQYGDRVLQVRRGEREPRIAGPCRFRV